MTTRQQLADLWREAAQITRQDIFGPRDALRPAYSLKNNILAEQIDIPAVGMIGPSYRGKLAILSVNGAGGKNDAVPLPSSNRMYAALRNLRDAAPGAPALVAFEALNKSVIASIPDWGVAKQHIQKILDAAQKSLHDIAYLYLVPFRTQGDSGSTMNQTYPDAGYSRHLVLQLRVVAPNIIIAIDRPSEQAAHRYRREAPHTNIIYYTRKRDAHAERAKTLAALSLQCAG